MIPGDVFFSKNYKFSDGDNADKLFVVVNIQRNNQHLVFKTTSRYNQKYRPKKEGCQQEFGYFHIPKGRRIFDDDTWIVLNNPLVMEADKLDQQSLSGALPVVQKLQNDLVRAIVNCFKKTQDFSQYHDFLLK